MAGPGVAVTLLSLAADSPGELHILWHDCDPLGMDGTQARVLEQADEVGLGCFLQCQHGQALEAEIGVVVLGDLPHKPLERKPADKRLGGLLVAPNLSECAGARPLALPLLHLIATWEHSAPGQSLSANAAPLAVEHPMLARTAARPWWPTASEALCRRWIFERFVWCEP